jgi:hypothetical protein
MSFLAILQIIAAVGTIATGLVALLRPRAIQGFIGLNAPGGRGVTELRSIFGGFFIALGAVPLVFNDPLTYAMLGIAYLTVAAVRAISMFLDDSVDNSNWISLAVEIVFGVILIL